MCAGAWDGFLPKNALIMAKRNIFFAPDSLTQIIADLNGCVRCKLYSGRTNIVPGEGNARAELVFVGEGPGEQEDLQGKPFVGKAGQLLDRMIEAIGLSRDQVYIANVVKCRPPGNRNPEADEIEACSEFLYRQLDVIQPKIIVALGKFAAQTLLKTEERITQLRGRFYPYRGAQLMPTFHPSYLLRNPESKREVWADLQQVALALGLQIPHKRVSPGVNT
jgi:uracil-DNA glycosylase